MFRVRTAFYNQAIPRCQSQGTMQSLEALKLDLEACGVEP